MKICDFLFLLFLRKMKKRRKPLILLGFPAKFLASQKGVEPPTFRLGGERSIQLSYWDIYIFLKLW